MNILEKHTLLKDWIMKKYNQPVYMYNVYKNWLYYSPQENYLRLIIAEFKKWQKLLKIRYSEQQLIDYFLEMVRHDLPELIGTKLYFSVNSGDNNIYKII